MKKILVIMSFMLLIIPLHIYSSEKGESSFRFSHLIYQDQQEKFKIEEDRRDVIKIFFQPMEKTWFYLLLVSPDNDIQVLFPNKKLDFDRDYATTKQFLSSGNEWFAGPAGQYSLFYLFSRDPLKDLEKHLENFTHVKTYNEKIKSFNRILAEIRELRRETELTSNIADLPAPIIGTVRNEDQVFNDNLLDLLFFDEDVTEKAVAGITDTIRMRLEETAVLIHFDNVWVKEVKVEYQRPK